MFPEFPAAREAIQNTWNKTLFEAYQVSNPLIAQLKVRVQKEGRRMFMGTDEIQFKKLEVTDRVKIEKGRGVPAGEYFERAERFGKEMAQQQAAHCYEVLSTSGPHNAAVEKTNRPFSFEDYLQSLETMEIDFDAAGLPIWPTGFLDAEAFMSVQRNQKAWMLTEDRRQRLEKFLTAKRREFNEREARRRLVD